MQGKDGVGPVGRAEDEGDELAGDLVDDDVAGVFAAGFAGDDGRGGDADQGREDCCGEGVGAGDGLDGGSVLWRTRGPWRRRWPQVPGPGLRRPDPKKVAMSQAQRVFFLEGGRSCSCMRSSV